MKFSSLTTPIIFFKFSMKAFHRDGQHATATTTTCWCEWGVSAWPLWRKCQLQGKKSPWIIMHAISSGHCERKTRLRMQGRLQGRSVQEMWLWPRHSSCKWDPSLPWYYISHPRSVLAKSQHLLQNINKQPTSVSCLCLFILYRNFSNTNKDVKKIFWIRMPFFKNWNL